MLIKRFIQTLRADAKLPAEIRAALIESLFGPLVSLILGAVACSIIGAAVALRVGGYWLMLNSAAIFAVGMLRVVSALLYRKSKKAEDLAATKRWEHVYEFGAWGFADVSRLAVLADHHPDQRRGAAHGGGDDHGGLRGRDFRP